MKTPSKISKAGREEFEKVIRDGLPEDYYAGKISFIETIKSHITSQEVKMLESAEEWAEREKKEENWNKIETGDYDVASKIRITDKNRIYNQALHDLITFLQEQSKLIKE